MMTSKTSWMDAHKWIVVKSVTLIMITRNYTLVLTLQLKIWSQKYKTTENNSKSQFWLIVKARFHQFHSTLKNLGKLSLKANYHSNLLNSEWSLKYCPSQPTMQVLPNLISVSLLKFNPRKEEVSSTTPTSWIITIITQKCRLHPPPLKSVKTSTPTHKNPNLLCSLNHKDQHYHLKDKRNLS